MRLRVLTAVLATTLGLLLGGTALAASTNGSGGDMPAFYDCELFTINFKPVSLDPSHAQINTIYIQDDLPMVLDQITGQEVETPPKSGFNPLWLGIQIVFNSGFTPHEFCRDDDIVAAAAAGEISLINTGQVFRCSVVGKK
jgi:hypothetical protein